MLAPAASWERLATSEPWARALGGKRVPGAHRGLAPPAQTQRSIAGRSSPVATIWSQGRAPGRSRGRSMAPGRPATRAGAGCWSGPAAGRRTRWRTAGTKARRPRSVRECASDRSRGEEARETARRLRAYGGLAIYDARRPIEKGGRSRPMALRPRLTTGLPFSTRQRSAEKFPAELAADPALGCGGRLW